MKGIGIIILVVAGMAAAFYFLKGKMGREAKPQAIKTPAIVEKRHTPVYKGEATKSQKEIHMTKVEKMREKGKACHRAYTEELARGGSRGTAQNNLAACIAAVRR